MDLVDEIEKKIRNGESVSNSEYENAVERITGKIGDYHFAEFLVRSFWEDVFPKLYGEFPKYKNIINEKHKR